MMLEFTFLTTYSFIIGSLLLMELQQPKKKIRSRKARPPPMKPPIPPKLKFPINSPSGQPISISAKHV